MAVTPSGDITVITADQVSDHLPVGTAIAALGDALRSGLDPQVSPARIGVPLEKGSFLLMPGEHGAYAGVKVLTVAAGNSTRGLPKIQGNYLLFDADTLRPLALVDGEVLTAIRTPAVSALAIDHLAPAGACSLLVFGTGPQALHHVRAVAAVRDLEAVTVVGRSEAKTDALLGKLRAEGHDARRGAAADVAGAALITCCTSAREPLFDGALVREDAVVVAVGSHEPDAREVDDALLSRSTVYVEDVETALREAGDVIIGIDHGTIAREDLHDLPSLVRSGPRTHPGPAFFKSVGMGWQDLVTAGVAYENVVPTRGR